MSDPLNPIVFRWTGDAMEPPNAHWARRADQTYVVGETYTLVPEEQRSRNSHNHQFAEISEAWKTLPEGLSALFPTAEALRKHALIKAGFADVTTYACGSQAEAIRLAAVIRSIEAYSVVEVRRSTVVRYVAQSQSMRAMGRAEFQRSKQACLEVVSDLIGVDPSSLSSARAA